MSENLKWILWFIDRPASLLIIVKRIYIEEYRNLSNDLEIKTTVKYLVVHKQSVLHHHFLFENSNDYIWGNMTLPFNN